MITDKLPSKPSALLRTALNDLIKVENTPQQYRVEMGAWADVDDKGICEVCLAGAALTHTCEFGPNSLDWHEESMSSSLDDKLEALNAFMCGDISFALRSLQIDNIPDEIPASLEIPLYDDDKEGFKKTLFDFADKLEAAGI